MCRRTSSDRIFFFLMIRRPPRSTLFPTRRSSDLQVAQPVAGCRREIPDRQPAHRRSEEHTSELQSQSNLVCRLLLEKKKKSDSTTVPLSSRYHRRPFAIQPSRAEIRLVCTPIRSA